MTNPNPARPCSPHARPTAGGDLRNRARPSPPSPLGGEHELEPNTTTPNNTPNLAPGASTNPAGFHPGTTWLITPQTKNAWTAALTLLEDQKWHPLEQLVDTMHFAGLAPRTITHHLRSASTRRWITQSRGRARIRNQHAIEHALAAVEDMDGAW